MPRLGTPVVIVNPEDVSGSASTGATSQQVQGNSASNAADVGNPVKIGGVVSSGFPAGATAGQRKDLWVTPNGAVVFGGYNAGLGSDTMVSTLGFPQADSATSTGMLSTAGYLYNPAANTWARTRGDTTSAYTKSPPLGGTDRSVTASTTSQQLMAANTTRSRILLRNDSTVDTYINFGATAVAAAGGGNYKLAANGGSLDLQGTSSAINIIAASGTPAISAREW